MERGFERLSDEEVCGYLPEQQARMHYCIIDGCRSETYAELLMRGWRRFGRAFFRPLCRACTACQSLRVPVGSFRPNRSMRRTQRRNRDLQVVLRRPPRITRDHLDLHQRYHADQAARRGWPLRTTTPEDYHQTFVDGHRDFGHELIFLHGTRLLAVALVDLLPQALSAVYCYYDPEERARSLGVFSVLTQIELARRRGIPYVYLGFWIDANRSIRYKANYRPHEILVGRPTEGEQPRWRSGT